VTVQRSLFAEPGAWSVAAGIALGLVVGKTVGITAASWVALKTGVGALPDGISWRQLAGAAAVAGIGFTVSLFIADLALQGPLEEAAKVAVLAASVLAAAVGAAILAKG
jgi:NhaA family Na+:H+ antiporter